MKQFETTEKWIRVAVKSNKVIPDLMNETKNGVEVIHGLPIRMGVDRHLYTTPHGADRDGWKRIIAEAQAGRVWKLFSYEHKSKFK